MATFIRDRAKFGIGIVWLILTLATWLNWSLGSGHWPASLDARFASICIAAVAMIKVRLVGRYFMELRYAPRQLQTVFDVVVAATFIMLTGGILVGSS